MRTALYLALVIAGAGCHKSSALAELVDAKGAVAREEGDGPWQPVEVGAKYSQGDAARTEDGGARLEVVGGAILEMMPHTTLRFGAKDGADRISVEAGAVELSNTTTAGLDVGDVTLSTGAKVRITATGAGKSQLELAVGEGKVTTLDGHTIELAIAKDVEITAGAGVVTAIAVDAGVADAAPVAAIDAGAGSGGGDVALDVTGKVEVQLPGETKWVAVAKDQKSIDKGAKLRVGGNGTAKLVARDVTLQLAGGSHVTVGDDLVIAMESGAADASVPINTSGSVRVPGGAVAIKGDAKSQGSVHLDVGKDTKVGAHSGGVTVTGTGDAALGLSPGESASLVHAGDRIQPLEAIPKVADFRIQAGETFTIHDPRPPTAVQFQFGGKCPDGGTVELDRDARFKTAKLSTGSDGANLAVQPGNWAYRVRCTQGGVPGATVASGRVAVERDDGHRPLPPKQPPNPVDADGRSWRISYQSLIPDIQVHYKGPDGGALKLHLAQGGKDQTFEGKAIVTVPGGQLKEGTYTYWFDRDGVKQDKVSTLKIEFDQAAPQVYIELPVNAQPFAASIDVRGAVLPGWSAAVDGVDLPLDKQRRFIATVQGPSTAALAIRLSHPQRGVHYYLRRSK